MGTEYCYQPDVLEYLTHVTDKYDLRQHMHFDTSMTEAHWDDDISRWIVSTSKDITYRARYLVTALGLLSAQNLPDYPGINDFRGEKYHTGAWPQGVNLKGKRVGVIGNGSTGVQVITAIAKDVEHLTCFQRNPQYSVPSGQGPVSEEYRQQTYHNYDKLWQEAKDDTLFAFGFKEVARGTFDVDEDERREIYEAAWRKGGGFRFMFETFGDITLDEAANEEASNFIKSKIRETVKDQDKARKLMPTQRYARRPLCDAGYYEQCNRENVDIVSLKETPITHFTQDGIVTSDGTEHELDVVIFATGFDAVDGNYTRLKIHGRGGQSLKEHWAKIGPTSYLGTSVPEFPNMFMILGPNGPFCNLPPAIETHVEFNSDLIKAAEAFRQAAWGSKSNGDLDGQADGNSEINGSSSRPPVIEATKEAEEGWTTLCDDMSKGSLFRSTDSWIFGSNVPGKKISVLFYFGGLCNYRKQLEEIAEDSWRGFHIS